MSRVKGKNTKPEKFVRSLLHGMGFRFRLHRKDLPGRPDIVLPKYRTAIFVHGCFWHHHAGCKKAMIPKQRAEFWETKMRQNIDRDKRNQEDLHDLGWNVIIVWQCAIERLESEELGLILSSLINSPRIKGRTPPISEISAA